LDAARCTSPLSGSFCARLAVLLAEFFNATGSVNDLLRASVKRVALGANFHVQRLAQGGLGLEFVAATAVYGDFFVFRMDVSFHFRFLAQSWARQWYALGLRAWIIHEMGAASNYLFRLPLKIRFCEPLLRVLPAYPASLPYCAAHKK